MHYSYYYFDSVEISSLMISWNVDKCEVIDITLKVADQLLQPFLVRNPFRGLQPQVIEMDLSTNSSLRL